MDLKVTKRAAARKSESKQARVNGQIPSVVYSKGESGEAVFVDTRAFQGALAQTKKGRLPTVVFTLVAEDGSQRRAVVKDIQYHVTTYDIIHLDFQEVHDDVEVNVNIPIECKGVADCVGIKHGGVLRQVIRHIKVRCLPSNIPDFFEINVAELEMKQTRRLSDLAIPSSVRPLANLNEVAVVIAKR